MGLKSSAIKQGQLNHQSDIYVAFSKKKPTQRMMMLLDRGLKKINP
jgi:polar amino acid transport system substrate-binding protein